MNYEVNCKNCKYYRSAMGAEIELTGRFEYFVQLPYGECKQLNTTVKEDEWCGAYKENEDV